MHSAELASTPLPRAIAIGSLAFFTPSSLVPGPPFHHPGNGGSAAFGPKSRQRHTPTALPHESERKGRNKRRGGKYHSMSSREEPRFIAHARVQKKKAEYADAGRRKRKDGVQGRADGERGSGICVPERHSSLRNPPIDRGFPHRGEQSVGLGKVSVVQPCVPCLSGRGRMKGSVRQGWGWESKGKDERGYRGGGARGAIEEADLRRGMWRPKYLALLCVQQPRLPLGLAAPQKVYHAAAPVIQAPVVLRTILFFFCRFFLAPLLPLRFPPGRKEIRTVWLHERGRGKERGGGRESDVGRGMSYLMAASVNSCQPLSRWELGCPALTVNLSSQSDTRVESGRRKCQISRYMGACADTRGNGGTEGHARWHSRGV